MIYTGLTSITFRKLAIEDIISLAKQASLTGVEWGGDVHVPPGDVALARSVKERTEAAGLAVCSYGSYYRCDNEEGSFDDTLASAEALGAPVIRVWAGRKGSAEADSEYRAEVVLSLRKATEAATQAGITVALEYHGGTLTDTMESAHRLLGEVGLDELKLYWQPRTGGNIEGDLVELQAALPRLSHVHAFHWGPDGGKTRLTLAEGREEWLSYIALIRKAAGDRFILFEFVRDDSPQQLLEDAKTLHALLDESTD